MKVLVTGVAGFIGSTLARRLLSDGYDVVGVDALTSYYDPSLKRKNLDLLRDNRFSFIEGDLLSVDLPRLTQDVEIIFHQAGQPGVRKSWGRDFADYTRNNVDATQLLLEHARDLDSLRRFVYASSSSVYGEADEYPTHEADLPKPMSPYGVTKLAAEHLAVLYAKNFNVPTVSLRYFTVYGPRQRPDMAFTRFMRAAIAREPITVFGTGEQVRDFTYVDDIVNANVLAGSSVNMGPGEVINLSGGSNISVNAVLDLISDISGRALRVSRSDPMKGDVSRTGGDSERARSLLAWTPSTELRAGLEAQYRWALEAFGD